MTSPNLNRRFFLRGKVKPASTTAVRPPWAIEESLFIDHCIRCDDCVTACPENIIIRGDGGFPEVNFKQGECTFCMQCAKSCKAEAFQQTSPDIFRPYPTENVWNLSVNIDSKCLSMNAVVCRSCGDTCEPQAIRFQIKLGGISEPHITQDNCTGCGACLAVCPVAAINIKPAIKESISA